ncbi:hypothetical protein AAD001_00685 [Colwelliaceae bacterium 6471]
MPFTIKPFIVITLLLGAIFSYFWFDDAVEPQATQWINYYEKPADISHNAFVYLIGLNKSGMTANEYGQHKYQQYTIQVIDNHIDISEKLIYPDPSLFPDAETDPLLCDINDVSCLSYLADNRAELVGLVSFYQPILKQYRQLASLDNFSFIDTKLTQSDFVFNTLSHLASLEILLAIWDDDFTRANNLLVNQIEIERALMANAFTVEFKIFPIIQIDSLYTRLIQLLLAKQQASTSELLTVLGPLTSDEFSFEKVWMKIFTDNLAILKSDNLYQNIRASFPEYNAIPLQLLYKEKMTINSIFNHHSVNSVVTLLPKATLISRLTSHADDIDAMQSNIFARYRNIIGEEFAAATAPRYLDISNGLIEFDLKLSLLRLALQSQQQPLSSLLNTPAATNPYIDGQAFIDEQQLCHKGSQDNVCIRLY